MKIVEIQIPISDWYNESVSPHSLFFLKSPTKQEVMDVLENLSREYQQEMMSAYGFPLCENCFQEAKDVVQSIKDWKTLQGSLIQTNTFVQHPKWGQQPVTWILREVY